jgi:hypothetical protein
MDIKTLVVVDADQYPLSKTPLPSKPSVCCLAASNNTNNLRCYGNEITLLVPSVPEAADTYLIIYLYNMLNKNNIDTVMITSGDKKLVYMTIVTCSLCDTRVELHPNTIKKLGGQFTRSCADMCKKLDVDFKYSETKRFSSICNHITRYKLGLKISTLSYHLSLP